MQIIESFHRLQEVKHIAWADGPGWLLGVAIASVMMGITAACISR